jgi:transcriptional regulator of met regulon
MPHWMFNCKEVSLRISESMDHDVSLYQRMLIRMHLLMCRYCARFRRQVLNLRELCRSRLLDESALDTSVNLPQDARERIRQALKS